MSSSHVAYDTQSGRIVAIHHGYVDAEQARQLAHNYARLGADARMKRHVKASEDQLAVISVPSDAFKPGKHYKVDVKRKVLVEAEPGEQGVGFSISTIQRS